MAIGRPAIPIHLHEKEKEQLESMTCSLNLPHGLVRPARMIRACAEGEPHLEIAKRLGLSKMTGGQMAPSLSPPGD